MDHQQNDQQPKRPAHQSSSSQQQRWPTYSPPPEAYTTAPYDDHQHLQQQNQRLYNNQQQQQQHPQQMYAAQAPPLTHPYDAMYQQQHPGLLQQQQPYAQATPPGMPQSQMYASNVATGPPPIYYNNQQPQATGHINYMPAQPAPPPYRMPQQHPHVQPQSQLPPPQGYPMHAPPLSSVSYPPSMLVAQPPPLVLQPQESISSSGRRLAADRPVIKLTINLIETYKRINATYYEERDVRRAQRSKEKKQQDAYQKAASSSSSGTGGAAAATANNNGWDDENYDYKFTSGEIFYGRYKIMERIGKGSFGQVVRAEDIETKREVAIKIIKSKKPFMLQAKTEIELLTVLFEKDPEDEHNLVRLLTHFMYRNHQCLVFEMLSLNLYELLKNTQFGGVSLNLIKKFAKQVLKALTFLARKDVDIIHCDLKPENILLRHPKKSAVKVIDFGSSCRSHKRMYNYIQSRFYRSPEVMLGLPYSVSIDIWSLGCILVEMHTGEPLFSGSDQFDQMQKIVKLLGMVPDVMLDNASDSIKYQFFEKAKTVSGREEWKLKHTKSPPGKQASDASMSPDEEVKAPVVPSQDPIASLGEVITAGSRQKKKYPPSETYNSQRNYELFVDLVYRMLAYRPEDRINPAEALQHPFLASSDPSSRGAMAAAST